MSFLLLIGPLGPVEILVVLFIGLLIFGARLPEVGKSLGKGLMEFKRGLRGIQDEMDTIDHEADMRVDSELERRALPTNPAEENAGLEDDLTHYDPSHENQSPDGHVDDGAYLDDEEYADDPAAEPGPEFGGDPQPDAEPEVVDTAPPAPKSGTSDAPSSTATSDTGTIVYTDTDYLDDDGDGKDD